MTFNSNTKHPFSHQRDVPPTVIVIFGASGDLTRRKLIPALYNLSLDGLLPDAFSLIGFGRKEIPDKEFRKMTEEAISEFSRRPLDHDCWDKVSENISYHAGNYDDLKAFEALGKDIDKIEKDLGEEVQVLFYVSTPPKVFEPILDNLGASGLATRHMKTKFTSKVIVEKPFGRDLDSAKELNHIITKQFQENQVYRIDHYLGKETVQDLLVQRFANAIFEPIWNRQYVESVQITVAESIGVGSRAGYYDQSGAVRDMIQNHTMQLLALSAMEPPVSLDPESIRDEKVKVLKAIQPLTLSAEGGDVVRGQYAEGLIKGENVPGYLQEDGVAQNSPTETFAALRLYINNWRWKGVPFYLRSGKRLAKRVSEIAIQFKRPPGILFTEGTKFDIAANTLVMRIQPDEGISLTMNSKVPGLDTRTQPVSMDFRYATTFGSNTPEAYERLILDATVGDSTLFIRGDETETSWKLYTPLLDYWSELGDRGLEKYVAGSWGPPGSDRLLWKHKHTWRVSSK